MGGVAYEGPGAGRPPRGPQHTERGPCRAEAAAIGRPFSRARGPRRHKKRGTCDDARCGGGTTHVCALSGAPRRRTRTGPRDRARPVPVALAAPAPDLHGPLAGQSRWRAQSDAAPGSLGGGRRFRGAQGQVQWRLQVTPKAVGGGYWRLEGRLQAVGTQAKA